MALTLSDTGTSFELAPAGTHAARLIKVIDMGSQRVEYQGQIKNQPKLLFTWELLGDEVMADGRPFTISKRFTASLAESSALRKTLEGWRGKAFTPEELKAFDLTRLIGQYCLISVSHSERQGRTYADVSSIMGMPKGMPKPEGVNPLVLFDLSKPDWDVYETFGEKMKAMISASPEYRALPPIGATTPFDPPPPPQATAADVYRPAGQPAARASAKPEPALAEAEFDDAIAF